MGILVYRDRGGRRDLVGIIDHAHAKSASFTYDHDYLDPRVQSMIEGILDNSTARVNVLRRYLG